MKRFLLLALTASLALAGPGASAREIVRAAITTTEIGGIVIAGDAGQGTLLVQRADGTLWVFRVSPAALPRLSGLRTGDEVVLAFDNADGRGDLVRSIELMAPRTEAAGVTLAHVLPFGVLRGVPILDVGAAVAGLGAAGPDPREPETPVPGTFAGVPGGVPIGTVFAAGFPGAFPSLVTPGAVPLIPGGTAIATASVSTPSAPLRVRSVFPEGAVPPLSAAAEAAGALGQPARADVQGLPFGAAAVGPGVAPAPPPASAGFTPTPQQTGPFTPGTIAPGVRQDVPSGIPGVAPRPQVQGPFTPGTVVPGVTNVQPAPTPGNTQGGRQAAPPPASGPGSINQRGTTQGTQQR